jgi:hypothetical protein
MSSERMDLCKVGFYGAVGGFHLGALHYLPSVALALAIAAGCFGLVILKIHRLWRELA